eukprot:SAG31_NODE_491_length_14923_cov_12.905221_8_plen_987_part_00
MAAMQVDDLDFEEVSMLRERSEALKKEYRSYLAAHPELTQLLSDLVNSCLVHKPGDVFAHAAEHFGLGVVQSAASEEADMLAKFEELKQALVQEAGTTSLADIIKFVFWEFDEDNNGTLETEEWFQFLDSFSIGYTEPAATKLHEFICGVSDANMTPAQLLHALDWLSDMSKPFEPLAAGMTAESTAVTTGVRDPMAATTESVAAPAHRVIVCGAPMSGKGSQSQMVIDKYGLKHITTGTMLQAAMQAGTDLGTKAKHYVDSGEMVPEALVAELMIAGMSALTGGWLLDGFPRTKEHAEAMKKAGLLPTTLLVLDINEAVLVEKATQRRMDPETGMLYHLTTNPPPDDIKDRLIHRADDSEDVVKSRLSQYVESKDAICATFADQVRTVDANREQSVVSADIVKILETGADAGMEASAAKIQATFRGKQVRKTKKSSGPKTFATEMEKWIAFKQALIVEAKAGGYQLPVLLKHVFWSFDSDNNGLLDKGEWNNFTNDVGKPHDLVFTQEESDNFHAFICESSKGDEKDTEDMSQEQLEAAMLKLKVDEATTDGPTSDGAPDAKSLKLFICGAPASGKGVQCSMLVEKYGVKHVSTGDLLRESVQAGSEQGLKAKSYMDDGKLVPDDLLVAVVAEGLGKMKTGWVLDGFPRSQTQAEALKAAGVVPDKVLVLDVPDDVLVEKVEKRRMDPETGTMYHLVSNPPPDDVKDRLVHRPDDMEEKIRARLAQYAAAKDAVCGVYSDVVSTVNANLSDDEAVSTALEAVLQSKDTPAASVETTPVRGVCVVGAPASGKGKLSQKIAQAHNLTHIQTGTLVKNEIAAGSELGKQAKANLDKDQDVHDDVLAAVVKKAAAAASNGWVMDGFPLSVTQAKAMVDEGFAPNVVLLVDVPDEVLVDRCVHRRFDPETGEMYDLKTNAPDSEEVTARLVQRGDDTEERVKERLESFQTHKDEVCTAFADIVEVIDGTKDAEEMAAQASEIIAAQLADQ